MIQSSSSFQKKLEEYALYIKISGSLLCVGGFIELISGAVQGAVYWWGSIAIGAVSILVGVRGIHSGFSRTISHALQFLVGVVFCILLVISLSIANIVGNMKENKLCTAIHNSRPNEQQVPCNTINTAYLVGSIVGLVFSLFCCTCFLFCAKSYHKELKEEASFFYSPVGVYTQPEEPHSSYQVHSP